MEYDYNGSLLHRLHRCSQIADELFTSMAGSQRLTPRQFIVLSTIASNEGSSQTAIVKLTGIDRSTMADIVRRMVVNGLLSRKRTSTDARIYAVTITEQGRIALKIAERTAQHVDEALLAKLTPEHRSSLMGSLAKLSD